MSPQRTIRGLSLSERLYRILLHAFPRQFREAYAADAVELFRDRYREEYRRAKGIGVLAFWGRSVWDAAINGMSTRWERWRERIGGPGGIVELLDFEEVTVGVA